MCINNCIHLTTRTRAQNSFNSAKPTPHTNYMHNWPWRPRVRWAGPRRRRWWRGRRWETSRWSLWTRGAPSASRSSSRSCSRPAIREWPSTSAGTENQTSSREKWKTQNISFFYNVKHKSLQDVYVLWPKKPVVAICYLTGGNPFFASKNRSFQCAQPWTETSLRKILQIFT